MTSEIGANALCMLACVVSLCTHTDDGQQYEFWVFFVHPILKVKGYPAWKNARLSCTQMDFVWSINFARHFPFLFCFFFSSSSTLSIKNFYFTAFNLFVRFWVSKQDWDSDVSIESINLNVEPVKEQEEPQSCADRLQQRLFRCVNLNGPKDKIDR